MRFVIRLIRPWPWRSAIATASRAASAGDLPLARTTSGMPAAQEAAEVEPRAAAELVELQRAQLSHAPRPRVSSPASSRRRTSLTGPARTSRMRCQCVPAQ